MINRIKNNPFAKNSLILFTGSMVANFLGYIFHLVVGRMVSVTVYGEVESLISLVAIISVPAGALGMVATKYSAGTKAEDDKAGSHEILSYFNRKICIYGLPIFLLAIALTPIFQNFLKIESIWPLIIVWAMMFFSFFGSVIGGILNGWQKFKDSSLAGIWGALVKLAAAIFFIKIGFAAGGVIGGFALGSVASYLFSLYFLKFVWKEKNRTKDYLSKVDLGSIKKYVAPVFMGNLAMVILSNADMVLAKHNLDPELAGQYGALTVVSKIIFFATGIIATVLFSMSAEDHHKKNNSLKTLKHAFLIMAVFSLAALAAYFLFPKFILSLLFGNKYQESSSYLIWFAISVVLFSFSNLFFQYLLSIQKTKVVRWLLAIALAFSLGVLFFGKSIGSILVMLIVAQVVSIVISVFYLYNKEEIKST